ncbi:MAG: YfiR family protein [Betaproteobacteria bacterium]|nr:YfiR family protein [Betaproteobacteria bacterium]
MIKTHWFSKPILKALYFSSALLILIGLITSPVKADEVKIENEIKAAFLVNFMLYVENNNERYLCLYSKKKFGEFIHRFLAEQNTKFGGLNININYIDSVKQASYCDAVFVSSDDMLSIDLHGMPKDTLTIGEVPDFLSAGGMIKFFIEDDRVYFAINIDAIAERDMMLSSQLLKLARTSKN